MVLRPRAELVAVLTGRQLLGTSVPERLLLESVEESGSFSGVPVVAELGGKESC